MGDARVITFLGRVGDRNERGPRGAALLGSALAARLGAGSPAAVGTPGPPLDADWRGHLDAAHDDLTALARTVDDVLGAGDRPVTVMPRCAVALATVPVVARRRSDACVVWFDAHADLQRPATTTSGYLGGMALSGPLGWWDSGHGAGLDAGAVVLVGARDVEPAEHALAAEHGVVTVAAGPDTAALLRTAVAGRPVYMHLDCDVLEPGIVPTEYAVPHGLGLDDVRAACTALGGSEVVGIEVAELQDSAGGLPDPDLGPLVEALAPLLG